MLMILCGPTESGRRQPRLAGQDGAAGARRQSQIGVEAGADNATTTTTTTTTS